jgi:uncharacterized protein (DUF924 family)/TolB-like protein/class 3 adenylate cyclase
MRVQRRLAAIAIADVVGYSRMMGIDESGTLAAVKERRKQIVEPVVAAHKGRIVKVMGDGFFLEFASAVNAVEAALAMQAGMAEANAGLAADRRIVLRIGINLGEVIVEGKDLFGDGINVAARLESIAPEGGIAISGSAYDQVKNRIGAAMECLGPQTLKNIAEPVRVYLVTAATSTVVPESKVVASAAAPPPAPAVGKGATEKPSIAILPFANLGDDPAQGFFSDGVTEDIITELARWRSLAVRSRSASFRYRGVAVDMKQVARELNVRFIVEGSVRRIGNRLRITAQLIDSETGSHIWAEKFDCESADIFSVQDQVVSTIVSTLVGRVQVLDVERARRKPPSSLAAYECLLQGNAVAWDTPSGLTEATRLFERAVEIDPGYGFAHAMLAATCYSKWYDDFSGSDALLQQAHAMAKRAVELDENESTCFSMLAMVCLLRHSYDLALQYARRAIEINPGNQWNNADMGLMLTYLGEPEEALRWFKRAREIDPYFDPPWYWRGIGQAHMVLHRYQEAVSLLERPSTVSYRISALKAGCHAQLGDIDAAADSARDCLAMKPEFTIEMFMSKEPYKNPADAAHQAESLRMAGLPDASRPDDTTQGKDTSVSASTADATEPAWVHAVLQFWFQELPAAQWFVKDTALDARIREDFLATHEQLVANDGVELSGPRATLAAVIVLDQFSRNLFRGEPRAFAADAIARRIATIAIERGFDRSMSKEERMFLYMPFQHSEDRADQTRALALMESLGNDNWTHFARVHKEIIDRFGRFPHRNAVLNRQSTAEEIEALKDPATSF